MFSVLTHILITIFVAQVHKNIVTYLGLFTDYETLLCGFTFQRLPATAPHHHLQSEVLTSRHPASSKSMSQQCQTLSGFCYRSTGLSPLNAI